MVPPPSPRPNLRLPGAALADQSARSLLEVGRKRGGGIEVGADGGEEPAEEGFGVVGRSLHPPLGAVGGEPVDDRVAERDPGRRRLDHRQRADRIRTVGGGQQRDDAAVRMPDEMVAGAKLLGEKVSIYLEVDVLDQRAGGKSAALD